jgi:hypothetical protein
MIEILRIADPSSALFDLTKKFGSDAPLKRIFQAVLSQNCRTILQESDHKDEEWTSEYKMFYSKLFKKHSDKTIRLHFFASKLTQKDLTNLSKHQKTYLGFCVLRPLESQRVVNAVIKPIEDKNYPKRWFLLCQHVYPVEITTGQGITHKLDVEGFAFIQQDGQLGCCSHVALAMADRFLVKKEKTKRKHKPHDPYLVGDIVKSISSVSEVQRLIPTEGLRPMQISEALKKMGYSPLVYEYGEDRERPIPPERVIYHYLESKIPIIVGIPTAAGKHALTVIGHSFEPDLWWALAEKPYYNSRPSGVNHHCSTTWLQNFIIHDDNFGPYLTIPKEFIWAAARHTLLVMIPLPPNVNITGEEAESIAYGLLLVSATTIANEETNTNQQNGEYFNIFYEHLKNEDLVLRTWLLPSEKFKKQYVSPTVADHYNNLKMPDKIWFTEVSIPELFCQARLRLGEVIIDPTASKTRTCFLAIHIPGYMISRNVDSEEQNFFEIANDEPFQHVMR